MQMLNPSTRLIRYFRLFTLHFLFLILSLSSFAQQNYPVQANLVIIPPNSPYLSDYVSQSGKMLVNLFMKDLTKSQYPSRLHVKIEGSGITIESKNDFYVEPFYLNGGEMTMLTGDDLAPYLNPQNLVYQGVDLKRSGGKLPDGLYQITVQVKDYYRKSVVSNAGFSLLSVFLSYPPIINLPFNQAKVRAMDPQNVMFQWTPRHTGSINAAYNVAYKFTLTEVFPGRDPNDAMRSTRPFYETFTDLTMLVYGPGEPALTPGNQYAVKVQAVEADGRDIFINNGNSEVSSFTYGDKCSVPTNMLAQVSGRSTLKVSWNETPLQQAFTVRYRQADNATAEWFEKEVFTAQAELQGLRQGYTYEYQIKAQCGYGYGDYSASERFSMPDENVTSGTLVCGKAPDGKTLDKSKLLPVLSPPMIFMAGDFPVVVTKATGQNGTFTGTGTVGIPFLNSLSFKVSFTNITINTDLQLVAGVVIVAQQSLLESKKQLVANITVTPDANGKVTVASQNGLPVIIEASFDTSQTPVFNPESKILTVYTTSKDMPKLEVTISGNLPQTIQDKDENTYEIAKDGTVKALGKVPVSELLAGSTISAKELSTNRAKVVFQKSGNQNYGFDAKKDTEFGNAAFEGNYQQVSGKSISWKSVETGKSDEVLARFENLDQVNAIDPSKIEFRNGSDEKLSSSLNTSDNTFTIRIIGSPEGNDKEIYAFYPDGKLNLTKLNIASYQKIEKKVVIVPVNGAGNNLGAGTVQNYLNTVYQQAVVSWQLTKADNFQVDKALYDSKDDGLDVDNSNAMSAYTAEQKTLATLYKNDHPFENNTYYIFLIDRFSDANQTGYMVRSGQVGFVSASDETTTMHSIAHELGHGAFNLKHSWEEYGTSQGTTQNLMDYSGGTDLIKAQWAYIRNPDWVFRAFEGDEDGSYETDGHYSTVYLVSLMLGMSGNSASQLAIATENPDTDVHSEMDFELDQTWANATDQKAVHALTGGFHGIEEFITAMKILYTPKQNVEMIGKLLHRYGDTYAHTQLDNIKPDDLLQYNLYNNPKNEKLAIESWKGQGAGKISTVIDPWISFFNYYTRKYGFDFLTKEDIQKQVLNGKTLSQELRDIYLINPSDNFKMYGSSGLWTTDHFTKDGSYPDKIYMRPQWYLSYVKNLAWLLAKKYDLDINALDISVFDKMIDFAVDNNCSLKGIIDYEIAKIQKKTEFFIPVFYSNANRTFASGAALISTDYYKEARIAFNFTRKYIIADGKKDITEQPEKNWDIKINLTTGLFRTLAFKIQFQ